MSDGSPEPSGTARFQRWIEANRAKIWIWGIAILALGGVGCMFLVVLFLIITR